MRTSGFSAAAVCLALAGTALAEPSAPTPAGAVTVTAGTETLTIWPYTTSDFETGSDPVNLVFPNADPRAIRQELMKLNGNRSGTPFASLPLGAGACIWMDAMGYEQAAWGEPGEWVGGAVQLACVASPAHPLGSPFRFHVRLFRVGAHTLGAAHFEILVPGTPEHEVLSWDLARGLVAYDVGRTGTVVSPVTAASLIPMGAFRAVRRPVFDALVGAGLGPLLSALFLFPPAWPADVPLLTSGEAAVLATDIGFEPRQAKHEASTDVSFNIVVPKPFCSSGSPDPTDDFVRLQGPLHFAQSVHTNPSGKYERRYVIGGTLTVTPMKIVTPPTSTTPPVYAPTGEPAVEASISEIHRAMITDHYDQATERVSQVLLGDPQQSLEWTFAAGQQDRFLRDVVCSVP
jgi:hypothetical protein